ncbi:hypothetical protein IGL98_003446 [Enterococcus sp. DIV0840]|uniref:DUF916 and DUF3324 domain-containing protein n=1 Tax=Enterococcus TaxID=1350 RepID=UPI001A8FFA4C|nr:MULTISPECIES: DUF916 and DUF3324 domain-containing protein [Enterococcus]MBO0435634.1 DUF916 and DUF3324 domain-containing protein [Enterococcus sp. DIV0849a]MBO0473789.1 DUF916 and DUF3324 domain-containing protein [Enterococcus ureasiticus]
MINKRKILRLIVVMIGVFLLSLTLMITKAQVGLAVSVKPILPKNQHNSDATYYDLRMKPGQKQDVQMELTNSSDKEEQVTLEINDATTNDAGDIDYSDRSKIVPRDKSLGVSFKDIATAEAELTIPAKKTITTTVRLDMPEKQFDGMILGGIKVVSSEKDIENSDSNNKEKQAKKTYIVAVKLTETDTPVVAKLNLLDVVFSKEANKNIIKATIQNDQAVNLEDIDFKADVYKKNSDKIFAQTKVTGYRMAPNSSFIFAIDGEKQGFQAGEYQIDLTAKSKATNQEWKWNKELEITKSENKKVENTAIDSEKDKIMFYTIICVITFVLFLLLLLLLLILRKRKEKRYEEALSYKKKKRDRNNKNSQRKKKPKASKVDGGRKKRPAESKRLKR